MRIIYFAFASLALSAMFVGCSREHGVVTESVFTMPEGMSVPDGGREELKLAQMSPSNVIVTVNGVSLWKRQFDSVLLLKAESIGKRRNMNPILGDKLLDQFSRQYIKNFVMQRLLVDEAFRLGVVTKEEVIKKLDRSLAATAEMRKVPVEKILGEYKDKSGYFLYEMAISYVMEKFIAEKIPPITQVTPDFVRRVREQVAIENKEAEATNLFYKAQLEECLARIKSGQLTFDRAVCEYDNSRLKESGLIDDGVWGEFEEGDFDDAGLAAAVFALPLGGISNVLEDEDGFHIVKVLSISPATTNEEGRVVRREVRKLGQVFLEKRPMMIEEGDVEMTQDLKNQMKTRAVDRYVSAMLTNGLNKVEYPHGDKLF